MCTTKKNTYFDIEYKISYICFMFYSGLIVHSYQSSRILRGYLPLRLFPFFLLDYYNTALSISNISVSYMILDDLCHLK